MNAVRRNFCFCIAILLLHFSTSQEFPCSYFDTVDLTNAQKLVNGSYVHDGVLIPSNFVQSYDYTQENIKTRQPAPPHPRGCICKLKACLNICCPAGTIYDVANGECSKTNKNVDWSNIQLNISMSDDTLKEVYLAEKFVLKNFQPCENMSLLRPELYSFDEWKLFANGTFMHNGDALNMLHTNAYCLVISDSSQVQVSECIPNIEYDEDEEKIDILQPQLPPQSHALEIHQDIKDGVQVPCSFFDTVNITGETRFPNGSYLHEGIMIPKYFVGTYDYVYTDLVTREQVEPHIRGCVCKLRPCISFCCPWGTKYNTNSSYCEEVDDIKWPEPVLNITLHDDTIESLRIFDFFAVQIFRPCEVMYTLEPSIEPVDDAYKLFKDGGMLRVQDNAYMSKNEYCMVPSLDNETSLVFSINPANCAKVWEYPVVKQITAMAMLFSIPFMVITIAVYLSIHELRNEHGKSLVCYLLGLIVGYSSLSAISLLTVLPPSGLGCKVLGYTAYYSFMVAFFWLSVISFDLWHNFRGTHRYQQKKRFLVYSLYAWTLPLIFLIFTYYAQEYADIPENFKPGIGGGIYCWLDMRTWSAMIYFFAPIMLIIFTNMVMFVMTATKIHRVQQELARIMAKEDSTKNLRSEKDRFGLFLRLFIVMGVTWSMEIISYFVGINQFWSRVFYVPDFCNAIQGFLIFMLFVMKQKIKHLIVKRIHAFKKTSSPTSQTDSTNSSNLDSKYSSIIMPVSDRPLSLVGVQLPDKF